MSDPALVSLHLFIFLVCTKRIHGVRYKCMHADCPDFDLCSVCESHPIALYPDSHPLLKPESVIPQVDKHSASAVVANRSRIWGFRHRPSGSENFDKQRPLGRPMLVPRLDEISPRISCTVPAPVQGARPLPVPPRSSGSFRVEVLWLRMLNQAQSVTSQLHRRLLSCLGRSTCRCLNE